MNQALGTNALERALAERTRANSTFFEAEAERLARLCHRMAERFARNGRLIALGLSPAARSDARHVAVEFVHPVIVGKRALPALALSAEGGPLERQVRLLVEPDDMAIAFGDAAAVEAARGLGCLTIAFERMGAEWEFEPPSEDASIRQELVETLYHVLWELVHVFFDHRGLCWRAARPEQLHDAGASSFLYRSSQSRRATSVRWSTTSAALSSRRREVGELRAQTLGENAAVLGALPRACARPQRGRAPARPRQRRLRHRRHGRRGGLSLPARPALDPRPALDLTEDAAILTAIANDIGTEAIFSRQVIAHGRPGDTLLAISTSGNSANVIAALEEARGAAWTRSRWSGTTAAGWPRAPCRARDRHALGAHPAHPGGPGERVPRAAGAGRLSRVRARVEGTVQGVGFRPHVYRLAGELGVAGHVLNDARGVVVEVEAAPETVDRFLARLVAEAPPLAHVERVVAEPVRETGEPGFAIRASPRGGEPRAAVTPDSATCGLPRRALRPTDRRFRYPFINCTNCGPRFTIVRDIPYDRPNTTMAGFAMCPDCLREYDDPADRRFHAQPNACAACGPSVRLLPAAADPLAGAVRALLAGAIVAVKGLGGFHLACLAADERAVARLRAQAPRGQAVRAHGARPGVRPPARRPRRHVRGAAALARAADRPGSAADAAVAAPWRPRRPRVMLPFSPLHHLLLADTDDARDDERQRLGRADRLPGRGRAGAPLRHRGRVPAA